MTPALMFNSVRIDRALGVGGDGALVVDGLGAGVNLLHGPNGAGKTTTARVMQELLWPGQTRLDRPAVSGRFALAGQAWEVAIDAARVRWWCDGVPSEEGPALGAAARQRSYCIALAQLLQEQERGDDVAEQVARIMRGGLDLEAARKRLGVGQSPPGRSIRRDELNEANKAVDAAWQRQREVIELDRGREELEQRIAEAEAAARELDRLRTAIDHRQEHEACAAIEAQLGALPAALAKLRGDELERARAIHAERVEHEAARDKQRQREVDARDKLAEDDLPEGEPRRERVAALRASCQEAGRYHQEVVSASQRLASAEARVADAASVLAEHVTEQQLAALARVQVTELGEVAREAEELSARRRAVEARLGEPAEAPADVETLEAGIRALSQWLSVEPGAGRGGWRDALPGLVASAVVLSLALVLAVGVHPAWGALALVGAALIAWQLGAARGGATDDRPAHARAFARLGLAEPASWHAEAVQQRLHELAGEVVTARLAAQRQLLREQALREQEELNQQQTKLDERCAALEGQLGIKLPALDRPAWLATLATRLAQWQQATHDRLAVDAVLRGARERYDEVVQRVNNELASFGYERSAHHEALAAHVEDLEQRRQRRDELRGEALDARRRLDEEIQPTLERLDEQERQLFAALGLEHGDVTTLQRWGEQLAEYRRLHGELNEKAAVRDHHARALADRPELLEQPLDELRRQRDERQKLVDELEALRAELARRNLRIEQAKQGHDLTDALAHRQSQVAAGCALRERECRLAVGELLLDHVRDAGAREAQPQVLRRADAHVRSFTGHRLGLALDQRREPPAFVARDLLRGRRRPLEELSSGERIQVLMAVRLAFIEHHETVKLPLVLDEALGNSDDERAAAIIDAVVSIARERRQVFYLSAQHDEVGKWLHRLEAEGLEHARVDLREARQVAALPIAPVEPPDVPAPGALSHWEYGHRLGVAPIDRWSDETGAIHLWHLLDDPEQLYALLHRGIETWGQFQSFIDSGGAALLDDGEALYQRAAAAVRVIETLRRLWRVGRGRPVDRATLDAADCVTDGVREALGDLAEQCAGDAEALLEQAVSIRGWGATRNERLRAHLEDVGCLDAREPIALEDARARALGACAAAGAAQVLDPAWLERTLGAMFTSPDAEPDTTPPVHSGQA